jgi:hypothetical protein
MSRNNGVINLSVAPTCRGEGDAFLLLSIAMLRCQLAMARATPSCSSSLTAHCPPRLSRCACCLPACISEHTTGRAYGPAWSSSSSRACRHMRRRRPMHSPSPTHLYHTKRGKYGGLGACHVMRTFRPSIRASERLGWSKCRPF